jgi:MFS family permease
MNRNTSGGDSSNGVQFILRAFKHRNYRLFFVGQGISFIGTWMQSVALGWMIYRLTESKLLLGAIATYSSLPSLIIAPLAGVLSDRWRRKNIIIAANILGIIQALSVAVLAFLGIITIWELKLLAIILGIVTGFDNTTRQAFVVEMVRNKEDLSSAIALNSSLFNLARIIGPTIGSIIAYELGEPLCFLLNALSFLAAITALLMMKLPPHDWTRKHPPFIHGLKEGLAYVSKSRIIRPLLINLALLSLLSVSYFMLMPVFVKDIYELDIRHLGYIMASSGMGSLLGAAFLASRKKVTELVRIIPVMGILFGTGIILFSQSKSFHFSMLIVPLCGFSMMVAMGSTNTLVQTVTDENKRGRVMSFYTMAFMGMMPIGQYLGGWLAEYKSAPWTLVVSGMICIAGSLVFLTRCNVLTRLIEPFHKKPEIVPEIPSALKNDLE